jgi:rRNA maturation endonuclease Nob1
MTGNRRFEFHIPHVFKHCESSLVRFLVPGSHSYCNHCGSQVLRNALKCKSRKQRPIN